MVENGVSSFCPTSPRSPSKRRVFTKHRVVQRYIYIYIVTSAREKKSSSLVLISGWQDRLATIIDAQRKKIIPMTGSINRVHIHEGALLPPPLDCRHYRRAWSRTNKPRSISVISIRSVVRSSTRGRKPWAVVRENEAINGLIFALSIVARKRGKNHGKRKRDVLSGLMTSNYI